MTDEELDDLIRAAMESGITHGLIPPETAELMRIRLASLTQPVTVTDRTVEAYITGERVSRSQPRKDWRSYTVQEYSRDVRAGLEAALRAAAEERVEVLRAILAREL